MKLIPKGASLSYQRTQQAAGNGPVEIQWLGKNERKYGYMLLPISNYGTFRGINEK